MKNVWKIALILCAVIFLAPNFLPGASHAAAGGIVAFILFPLFMITLIIFMVKVLRFMARSVQ